MSKDTIAHFVCFVTNLGPDEFAPKWEQYAKRFRHTPLLEQVTVTKNKFRYVSRHESPTPDIQFSFMNDRKSIHFPEHNVRVVQIGGYLTRQGKKGPVEEEGDCKLIAFLGHNENDPEFYRQLPHFRHLTVHQAFYESCAYGYVLEFLVPENESDELLALLKERTGVESGVYKECLVPHV